MEHPKEEKSYLMIKPDGVRRGLMGDILHRVEQRGLKIIALRMVVPTKSQIDTHYPKDEKWVRRLGEKTLMTYKKYGYDAKQELGTSDPDKIGKMVRNWLIDFMTSGPVVKVVVQGVHAIDMVRKICGHTIPSIADMGTIRGDYSTDSAVSANKDKRAIYNIVHASETMEEAGHEIDHWFNKNEVYKYDRTDDSVYRI